MGGDFAPEACVEGALLAIKQRAGLHIILTGQEAPLHQLLEAHPGWQERITVVHAPDVIGMGAHPTKAFQQTPNNSIMAGFKLLATGQAAAFCSAGNTGAMMVGAMLTVKTIPGILRPAIAGYYPQTNGRFGVIVDVGLNAECKPEMLAQFGEMGAIYAAEVLKIDNPRVGLMNVGEEPGKGPVLLQNAFQLLSQNPRINFIGNMEGRDLFANKADVVVCDGFTGNVVLKLSESVYDIMFEQGLDRGPFFSKLNYEEVGGSPVVGLNANVVIGHGVSTPKAIANMVLVGCEMAEADVAEKLKQALSETQSIN